MVMIHRKASKDLRVHVLGFQQKSQKRKSKCCDKINKKGKYCKRCPLLPIMA